MITVPYIIATIILTMLPGTGVIYTISTAFNHGRRASILASIGCTLGLLPHLALSILTVYLFKYLPDTFFTVFKYAGAAYLIYIGYSMMRSKDQVNDFNAESIYESRTIVVQAILLNLLNPKLTLFFISFLPQYIVQDGPKPIYQAIGLGTVPIICTLLIFILYGILASQISHWLLSEPKKMIWTNRIFGGSFILFALALLK